jgi:hypothetical protein
VKLARRGKDSGVRPSIFRKSRVYICTPRGGRRDECSPLGVRFHPMGDHSPLQQVPAVSATMFTPRGQISSPGTNVRPCHRSRQCQPQTTYGGRSNCLGQDLESQTCREKLCCEGKELSNSHDNVIIGEQVCQKNLEILLTAKKWLLFEKNADFFAEHWRKSQKIVIIISTPVWWSSSHAT